MLVSRWEAAGGAYSKHQRGGTHGTWKAAFRGQTEAGQELTDIFWTTSILYPRTRSIILTFKQTQLREKAPSSQRHFKFLAREVKDRSLSLLQELSAGSVKLVMPKGHFLEQHQGSDPSLQHSPISQLLRLCHLIERATHQASSRPRGPRQRSGSFIYLFSSGPSFLNHDFH